MKDDDGRRKLPIEDVLRTPGAFFSYGLGKFKAGSTTAIIFMLLQIGLLILLVDDITVTEFSVGIGGEQTKSISLALDMATWLFYAAAASITGLGLLSLFMKFYNDSAATWSVRILIGIVPIALVAYIFVAVQST